MRKPAGILFVFAVQIVGSAQASQPFVSSFASDGTMSWSNTSTNCVAVVEEFSPATSGHWVTVHAEIPTALVSSVQITVTNSEAMYRVINADNSGAPTNMVLIPDGTFLMGDFHDGFTSEQPVHAVSVSAFHIDAFEVTRDHWDQVYLWATNNGYVFDWGPAGKSGNHPIHSISWFSAVKWCNARSEFEGLWPCYYTDAGLTNVYREDWLDPAIDCVDWQADGYRLPTEAEWEKAARGGRRGTRFPWGSTIDHSHANYQADGSSFEYDTSPYSTWTPHPDYDDGTIPFTSPVGSFAANGYGIHDTSGNVWEWCWDMFGFYSPAHATDPQGASIGHMRTLRGGGWTTPAETARCAYRIDVGAPEAYSSYGFRCVRGLNPWD